MKELGNFDFYVESRGECKYHYHRGVLSRSDGPAIESPYCNEWHLNGLLHRECGPAVQWSNGIKEWWVMGKRHRLDGPAVEEPCNRREWWIFGKRHRIDGPAIEDPFYGNEWWVDGVFLRDSDPHDSLVPQITNVHQAASSSGSSFCPSR